MGENMQSTQRIGFHESTINSVHNEAGALVVELDGVHFGDTVRPASVRIAGIQAITRDGIPTVDLLEECKDGEVLTLQYSDQVVQLIVECTDFKNHRSQTYSYRIACDSVEVEGC